MRGPNAPKAGTEWGCRPDARQARGLGGQVVEFPPQLRDLGFQGAKPVVSPRDFGGVITGPFRM